MRWLLLGLLALSVVGCSSSSQTAGPCFQGSSFTPLPACAGNPSQVVYKYVRAGHGPTLTPSDEAIAAAARLRCQGVRLSGASEDKIGFAPVAQYRCALPKDSGAVVFAYTEAQMQQLREPALFQLACNALGSTLPSKAFYAVYGRTFVASVQLSGYGVNPRTDKERSEALAHDLGLKLTTIQCH